MRRWMALVAVLVTAAVVGLVGPASAEAAPFCGIRWGSLDKAGSGYVAPLVNVRAGQHTCYDRLVLDFAGTGGSYRVRYVSGVPYQAKDGTIPLRGGAFLEIVVGPSYDPETGATTYDPANEEELVNVSGWRTFRQVAYGGSFEGATTIGLGVRARLPYRVFTLAGPGTNSRLVIDVAHRW